MTSALSTTAGSALAASAPEWEQQIDLVKAMCAKDCTNTEFGLLIHLAKTYQLDPLARQIWAVKYGNNPAAIFAGRDGFLAIAHRSGVFDGMQSGSRKDGNELVGWAKVYRKDYSHPFEVEVYFDEYGKDARNPLWRTKPRTMLQKVAEAQCLRKAFAVSGLYSQEEIDDRTIEAQRGLVDGIKIASRAEASAQGQMREVADTSRAVPAQVTHVHRPEPTPSQVIPDSSIPVVRCDVCGRGNDQYPDIRIRLIDGRSICGSCQRKAEKAQTEKVSHVPSPASPKAIPTGITPPTNGIPAPASHFVCGRCGRQMPAAEKSPREMFGKSICVSCAAGDGRQPTPEGEA